MSDTPLYVVSGNYRVTYLGEADLLSSEPGAYRHRYAITMPRPLTGLEMMVMARLADIVLTEDMEDD